MNCINRALAVALVTISSTTSSHSQSSPVINTIKSAAWAQVIENKCPRLEMDWPRYGLVMSMAGLKPEDIEPSGKHGQLHGAFLREALNHTESSSTAVICATGVSLYGPKGRNVPDLLVPRK